MHSIALYLALAIAVALLVRSSKESFGGYAKLGNTNFPGADLDTEKVKKTSECAKLCDSLSGCKGFAVNKNKDADGMLTCWPKGDAAIVPGNRKKDISKSFYVKQDHWNYAKTLGQSADGLSIVAGGNKDDLGRGCLGKATIYDNINFEGTSKDLACGTGDTVYMRPKPGYGTSGTQTAANINVSSVKIPKGLKVQLVTKLGTESQWFKSDVANVGEDFNDNVVTVRVRAA